MKIKNTSKKLIHIGTIPLMPGEETTVANTIAEAPSIQVLAKHGLLELTAEKKAAQPKAPTPAITVAAVTEDEPPKAEAPKATQQRGNKAVK